MKDKKARANKRPSETSHLVAAGEVFLTRKVEFAASHRLFNPAFSEEQNEKIFGLCAGINGHGHNYVLEVTVVGQVDKSTGMVINLKDLKRTLQRLILKDCDHKHLNHDVSWLADINPTAENLAVVFWQRLEKKVRPARLHRVRVLESDANRADYFGPAD